MGLGIIMVGMPEVNYGLGIGEMGKGVGDEGVLFCDIYTPQEGSGLQSIYIYGLYIW
jgi:hypothetical protein